MTYYIIYPYGFPDGTLLYSRISDDGLTWYSDGAGTNYITNTILPAGNKVFQFLVPYDSAGFPARGSTLPPSLTVLQYIAGNSAIFAALFAPLLSPTTTTTTGSYTLTGTVDNIFLVSVSGTTITYYLHSSDGSRSNNATTDLSGLFSLVSQYVVNVRDSTGSIVIYSDGTTSGLYTTYFGTPPSPPSISTGTINPPNADGSNFYLSFITSVGTASIHLFVKRPNDTNFVDDLGIFPLSQMINGQMPIQLPFSTTPIQYGTYSFQAFALNSSNVPSSSSNIATITVNAPISQIISYALTIKAIDGTQQTFILSPTDDASELPSLTSTQLISNVSSTTQQPINTLQDIANFFQAHNVSPTPSPSPTPAPTNLTATVTGQDVFLTWISQNPISLTVDGIQVVNNYAATAYTRYGMSVGTHNFTIFATLNGVNSTPVSISATVSAPQIQPTWTPSTSDLTLSFASINVPNDNHVTGAVNVQVNQNLALNQSANLFISDGQNVATNIPFTISNQSVPFDFGIVPIGNYTITASANPAGQNSISISNVASGQFQITPPGQPNTGGTQPKNLLKIAGGIFAGLITLSLFTSGTNKKVKRKHA